MSENPLKVLEGDVLPPEKAPVSYKGQTPRKRIEDLRDRTLLANGLTRLEEAFCRAYVRHGKTDLRKAYLEAGYQDPTGKYWNLRSKKLLKKEKIQKRIAELEDTAELTLDMSKEKFIVMCLENRTKALQDGDHKGANDALALIGKALDYIVEKKVAVGANLTPPKDMTPEERMERVKKLAALVGMSVPGVSDGK